jgi:hypothetical protein
VFGSPTIFLTQNAIELLGPTIANTYVLISWSIDIKVCSVRFGMAPYGRHRLNGRNATNSWPINLKSFSQNSK